MNSATLRDALLRAALDTADRGWPVFPLVPRGKRPALHRVDRCPGSGACVGGHQGWEERATLDPDRIRRAWNTGAFNIGIPTGRAGLVVVDLDTPNLADPEDQVPDEWAARGVTDGAGVLAWLTEQAGAAVPLTRTVTTPSGGRHLYFRAPTDCGAPQLRNTQGEAGRGLGWKVDTRANGGYVVGARSRTSAGAYRTLDEREPAVLPEWLLDRLRPPVIPVVPTGSIRTATGRVARYVHGAIVAETRRVHEASSGQRNACLYVAACALGQLVAGGSLPDHLARGALLDAAARHIAVGAYSADQAAKTIASGLRAGARRPRRITDDPPTPTASAQPVTGSVAPPPELFGDAA